MTTRTVLVVIFGSILLAMLAVTTYATLDRSIFSVGEELFSDPWFIATLCDAYFGFLTFYVWVAYKESTLAGRLIWFAGIMLFGNIAIAIYMLIQLARYDHASGIETLLLRASSSSPDPLLKNGQEALKT